MFTGLVNSVGKVSSIERITEGYKFIIYDQKIAKEVKVDDSVSINGACQTVVSFTDSTFTVQAVQTTLNKTNFKSLKSGSFVNLELAMRLSDRLGGHLVQGHVNGTGEVLGWQQTGKNYELEFKIPTELMKYVVKEGSITLNGVSLTVSDISIDKCCGKVSIIPHTWDNTVFKYSKRGDMLNLEVDILAKYVENLLFHGGKSDKYVKETSQSKLSEEWIKSQGFWN